MENIRKNHVSKQIIILLISTVVFSVSQAAELVRTSDFDKIEKASAISLDRSLLGQYPGMVSVSIENIENRLTILHRDNSNNNVTQIAWLPYVGGDVTSINIKGINSIFLTDFLTGCKFLVLDDHIFHIDAILSAQDVMDLVKAENPDFESANGYLLLPAFAGESNGAGNNEKGVFYYDCVYYGGEVGSQETMVVGHVKNGAWTFKYKTYNPPYDAKNKTTNTKTTPYNWIKLEGKKATGKALIEKFYDIERQPLSRGA